MQIALPDWVDEEIAARETAVAKAATKDYASALALSIRAEIKRSWTTEGVIGRMLRLGEPDNTRGISIRELASRMRGRRLYPLVVGRLKKNTDPSNRRPIARWGYASQATIAP